MDIYELKAIAKKLGIRILHDFDNTKGHLIGIHLKSPTLDELERAIETAERDMYPNIIIHEGGMYEEV